MEFKAKASVADILLTIFSDVFFVVAVVIGAVYGINVLVMAVLLGVCGAGCTWNVLHQPIYIFERDGLVIKEHFPLKDSYIPFDRIRNFCVMGNFKSIITKASNRVDITYQLEGKDKWRSMVCTPADVYGFVDALKKYSGNLFN